jgi:hypothetical protein
MNKPINQVDDYRLILRHLRESASFSINLC